MGCNCPSTEFSSNEKELKSELNTTRNFLLSKNKILCNSNSFQTPRNSLNLYSTQNIRHFESNLNVKQLSNSEILEKQKILNSSQNLVPRLSVQKFNELFDNSSIECYNAKPSNIKNLTYIEKIYNSKINNNIEPSLNTTFEYTTVNTIVSKYKKKNNIKNNKKKNKEKLLYSFFQEKTKV